LAPAVLYGKIAGVRTYGFTFTVFTSELHVENLDEGNDKEDEAAKIGSDTPRIARDR